MAGLLLVIGLDELRGGWFAWSWLASLAGALALRLEVARRHARASARSNSPSDRDRRTPARWMSAYRLAFLVHGLVWACAAPLLADDPRSAFYVWLVVLLLVGGCFIVTPFDLLAPSLFGAPALLALGVSAVTGRIDVEPNLAIVAALLVLTVLAASLRSSRMMFDHAALRHSESRRLAELQHSEERLNEAQRVAQLGSFDWDPVSGALEWSDEHFRLWGLAPRSQKPNYALFRSALHPDDLADVELQLASSLAGQSRYDCIHRVVGHDGVEREIHGRAEVMFDDQGRAIRMIGTVLDVTERRQAQRVLEIYRVVVDSISDPVGVFDEQQILRLANAAWYRSIGLSPDDALHRPLTESQMPGLPQAHEQALQSCLQLGQPGRLEAELDLPGSGKGWWEVTYYPCPGLLGARRSAVVVGRDVTERHRAAQELERSFDNLHLTLNATGDAIFASDATDPHQPLLFANERMFQIWGIPSDEALSLSPAGVMRHAIPRFRDPQREIRRIQELVASSLPAEDRVELSDGRVLLRRCIPKQRDGRWVRVWSFRDISTEDQALRQVELARDDAQRANRAKSEFLSSMSHELRTPLNAILGFGQLLQYDPDLPAPLQEDVQEILQAGHHLLALINEILDLSRVESGRVAMELESVDLDDVLVECLSLMAPQAQARELSVESPMSTGLQLRADRKRLKQVLLNLLSNAVKYNREGGRIRLGARPIRGGLARISIADDGHGIAPHLLPELFQPFNRLGAEATEIEGTGIGLTITRRLVELMQGEVGVSSQPGEGSTFWIDLPLSQPLSHAAASAPTCDDPTSAACDPIGAPDDAGNGPGPSALLAQRPTDPAEAPTVLYVEDNPSNTRLLAQMLRGRADLRLLTAHSGELGLALARSSRPALILTDIHMPGMDGFELLRRLRADPRLSNVPVLAVTANAMPDDARRGMAAGFAAWLTKPLQLETLLDAIDRHLPVPRMEDSR